MSFVCESPLTGPGAGGFMLVHAAGGESLLLDFFVAAPGRGLAEQAPAELVPIDVHFSAEAVQVFNVGASSCGVPGTLAGLSHGLERFGSMPLVELAGPAARASREGVVVGPMQAYLHRILAPILGGTPEGAALYGPPERPLGEGELLRQPELGNLLERFGAEGPRFLYEGEVAAALSDWVLERGGLLTREDLDAYVTVEREPARTDYRGRQVLTNPPPSSGGILIAYSLALLAQLEREPDPVTLVEVMARANAARTEDFVAGLHSEGYLERFLARDAIAGAAETASGRLGAPAELAVRVPPPAPGPNGTTQRAGNPGLGSTTHVAVLDECGACASVTCSNGSGSGVFVPGTGVHLNNMLGEQDLNPFGFHRHEPGRRIPSMMAPTVVLRAGEPEVALGAAGSNRIRSAVLQTLLGVVDLGLEAEEAVARPRLHLEGSRVDAEPGIDEDALARLELAGYEVQRWRERNLFFGGVQAVARDPATAELSGRGDPRRGGAAAVA